MLIPFAFFTFILALVAFSVWMSIRGTIRLFKKNLWAGIVGIIFPGVAFVVGLISLFKADFLK